MAPTIRRTKPVWVYFVAYLDKPADNVMGWQEGKLLGEIEKLEGEKSGCYFTFKTRQNEKRLMKVAISYVSIAQARLNMEQELTHWNFDKVREESQQEWNQMLSRIEIEGGSETEQRRFYTDLWHVLQGRRIISDVNGKYCDMTGDRKQIKQIPLDDAGKPKFNHYNSDSFWGAQWTLNTLWHLVYPEISEEFVNSMLLMYQDGGLVPRGPSGGNYTYVMTGASSTPFIVSAYMKGIRGYDVEIAYEGLKKNHLPGGMMSKAGYEHNTSFGGGLDYYIERGYVPHPLDEQRFGFHQDGSAQTLEYAYQDWTLAQLAKVLRKNSDFEYFEKRAKNYKNVWNPQINWMWIKNLDGSWLQPIDILRYGNGWVEGNAAQFTWFVPHDLDGLAELMGGKDSLRKKLNLAFELAQKHGFVSSKSHDQEKLRDNRRVYINYGNQPSIQTAYVFNYAGAPWLTQYWSRQVVDSVYSGISPQFGYSGDEDQGLMGSLAVLMKMGLFSMKGGAAIKPVYELGSPVFNKITIHLNQDYYPGKTFVVETINSSPDNFYIQSATINGDALDRAWLYHETVIKGGKLTLHMGPEPNKSWGSSMLPHQQKIN
jgi:predicted alpha-1,2-mannosidase